MTFTMSKWAGDYELDPKDSTFRQRKVLRYRGWTIKVFFTGVCGCCCGFPYEYRLIRGSETIQSRTSYISKETCLANARLDVDAQS